MVCFSSYALITEQATAAEDVRFFGQKAFGSVGSREREREEEKRHFKCSPTRYYLPSCSQARCSRSPETVCGSPKIICQKEFFFTYAVCYMYRQSSDVHWQQQQQRSDCTQQYQQQSKAENEVSKQTNERTEQRTAPEEDFYDYGSIHLPFCLVAVVISVAGAGAIRPPPLPSRRQLDEQDCCCWWLLIHEEASGASFLSSESHSLSRSF